MYKQFFLDKGDSIHLVDFRTVFQKGDNFNDYLFAFLHTKPLLKRGLLWKGVYSKRKEFAPKGSKFLPFRVDPL